MLYGIDFDHASQTNFCAVDSPGAVKSKLSLSKALASKNVSIVSASVSETQADEIETFLDARANDSDSFDFTAPGESTAQKFVCQAWSKSIPYNNRATIQATFREVFEP